ncbi:hypothetical protein BDW62DRAFT_203042 [Aspergillus aurantiobrunneus]
MNAQSRLPPLGEYPNEHDLSPQELKNPLRECHSIPHSLPPSFPQRDISGISSLPSLKDPPEITATHPSKSVRFALGVKSIQYFNPTEKPSSVQKMAGTEYSSPGGVSMADSW